MYINIRMSCVINSAFTVLTLLEFKTVTVSFVFLLFLFCGILLAYPRLLLFSRWLLVGYRFFFGVTYRSHLEGPSSQSSLSCAIYLYPLLYVFKIGQHSGHGEDLLVFLHLYRPTSLNIFQTKSFMNTRRWGHKIHVLYVILLDNVSRKRASECLPQETMAFPVINLHQTWGNSNI
jgi:hypothetical protein